MKKLEIIITFVLLTILLITTNTFAQNYTCNSCSNCSNIIQNTAIEGDSVQLIQDLNSNGTCIDWGSYNNGITLDCQNFKITGNYTGTGIYGGHRTNTTIKNCKIINFNWGIYSYGINNSIFNNSIDKCNEYGILANSYNSKVFSNIINNATYGFRITANTSEYYLNQISNSKSQGIQLVTPNHKIYENLIFNNEEGISLSTNAKNNIIEKNNIYSNSIGIAIKYNNTNFNIIKENQIYNNVINIRFSEYNGYPKNNTIYKNYLGDSSKISIGNGIPENYSSNKFIQNYFTDFNTEEEPFCFGSSNVFCDTLASLPPQATPKKTNFLLPSGSIISGIIILIGFFLLF